VAFPLFCVTLIHIGDIAAVQDLSSKLETCAQNNNNNAVAIITPPPVGGRGIVFERFLCFFVCFFVSKIAGKRLDRFP